MYKIGDYVAHYRAGVCEVMAIGKLDMRCSDREKEYYTLRPVYDSGGTLYTPVANERGQLRAVISGEEAGLLIQDMPKIEELRVEEEKKRETRYKEAMLKNECRAWISLIKTAYLRKMKRLSSGKKVINVDDKYLTLAERFLYGELAAALKVSKEEIKNYILGSLQE